jgi:hypothetical protein
MTCAASSTCFSGRRRVLPKLESCAETYLTTSASSSSIHQVMRSKRNKVLTILVKGNLDKEKTKTRQIPFQMGVTHSVANPSVFGSLGFPSSHAKVLLVGVRIAGEHHP